MTHGLGAKVKAEVSARLPNANKREEKVDDGWNERDLQTAVGQSLREGGSETELKLDLTRPKIPFFRRLYPEPPIRPSKCKKNGGMKAQPSLLYLIDINSAHVVG